MMIAIIRNFEKLRLYAFTKVMLKRNHSVKEQTKGRHLQVSVNRGIRICLIVLCRTCPCASAAHKLQIQQLTVHKRGLNKRECTVRAEYTTTRQDIILTENSESTGTHEKHKLFPL